MLNRRKVFFIALALCVAVQAAAARPWLAGLVSHSSRRLSEVQKQMQENQLRRLMVLTEQNVSNAKAGREVGEGGGPWEEMRGGNRGLAVAGSLHARFVHSRPNKNTGSCVSICMSFADNSHTTTHQHDAHICILSHVDCPSPSPLLLSPP